jgi:hypothetical protein
MLPRTPRCGAERDALEQRVFKLEEELALAQLHRFAPRSETVIPPQNNGLQK